MKIKKGDLVKVIAGGKDRKGKVGRVIEVLPVANRVRVEGVAVSKRHLKPQAHPKHPEGGVIEKTASIHLSNVMLMSEDLGRPVRLGAMLTEDGKKVRIARGRNSKAQIV